MLMTNFNFSRMIVKKNGKFVLKLKKNYER